jgi:hypothetical protein
VNTDNSFLGKLPHFHSRKRYDINKKIVLKVTRNACFFKFNHKAYKLVVFNYFLLTTSRLVLLLSIDMKLIHSVATTRLLLGMEFLIYIIVLNCFVEMLFKSTKVKEIIETIIRWSTKSLKRVETKSFGE